LQKIHDLGKIVAFYQLWADNLYPKATFRDSLAIIEKLGHSKTMKAHRLGLIQNYKDSMFEIEGEKNTGDDTANKTQAGVEKQTSRNTQTREENTNDEDDDLHLYTNDATTSRRTINKDSLFLDDDDEDGDEEDDDNVPINTRSRRQLDPIASNASTDKDNGKDKDGDKHDEEEEDEDFDLDEMLAQSEQMHQETIRKSNNDTPSAVKPQVTTAPKTTAKKSQEQDDFDDEMEAMAALDQDGYMN